MPALKLQLSDPVRRRTRSACAFFFQAEDGIRDADVTGVQTCALPISPFSSRKPSASGSTLVLVDRRRWYGPAIFPRTTSGSTQTTRPSQGFDLVVSRAAVCALPLRERRACFALAFEVSACCDALTVGLAGAAAGCCVGCCTASARRGSADESIKASGLGSLLRPLRSTSRHGRLGAGTLGRIART